MDKSWSKSQPSEHSMERSKFLKMLIQLLRSKQITCTRFTKTAVNPLTTRTFVTGSPSKPSGGVELHMMVLMVYRDHGKALTKQKDKQNGPHGFSTVLFSSLSILHTPSTPSISSSLILFSLYINLSQSL